MQNTTPHTPTVTRPMPKSAPLREIVANKRGDNGADSFMRRAQSRYDELYARRPPYEDRALRWHLEENILVGLALYETLREEGLAQEDAYVGTHDLLAALAHQTGISIGPIRLMKRFVPGMLHYPLVRRVLPRQMRLFPSSGWQIEWVENSRLRVAFNITRCFYLDVLTRYGAPELTPAFCDLDNIPGEMLKPNVVFERKSTLGRGAACCDFCYRNGRA